MVRLGARASTFYRGESQAPRTGEGGMAAGTRPGPGMERGQGKGSSGIRHHFRIEAE